MYTTMIFDFDGLLVDSEQIFYRVFNQIIEEHDCGKLTMPVYTRDFSGHSTLDNCTRIVEEYHVPITVEECIAITQDRTEVHAEVAPLKPGVKELLQYLKEQGYKIVIATSSTPERVQLALETYDIDHYFMATATVGLHGNSKPAPDVYLNAANLANCKPEEALAFEDSEAGILSAHNAGMDVICIPDLKQPGKQYKDLAKAILPTLADVIKLLEQEK